MPIFLKITLLGVFAAAGVGAAIGFALHGESIEIVAVLTSEQPAPPPELADKTEAASKHITPKQDAKPPTQGKPETPPPAVEPPVAVAPAPLPQAPTPIAAAAPFGAVPASVMAEYRAPLASQLDRLEQQLSQLTESQRQEQFSRLEEKVSQFEALTRESQRKLGDQLTEIQAQTAQQPAPVIAPPPTIVEAPALAPPVVAPEVAPPQPKQTIIPGEGDGRLTIDIKDGDIREVLEYLSHSYGMNLLLSDSVRGAVTASLINVEAEEALTALLRSKGYVAKRQGSVTYVGSPAEFATMSQNEQQILTRVYRPNYATATELMTLVTPLLTPNLGQATPSSPAEIDIPPDSRHTGGDQFAGRDVLLVRDYESVLTEIDAVVAQVDTRPRQVAIEAMVLSVNLDDEHQLGVNFELLQAQNTARLISGSPLATLAQIDVSQGGLNVGFLNGDLGAFINALERIGDTNVVARPRLMCLNKQRAEILIGDQIGFLSTTQTETATTQTVEFLDVGTQLRIRPFIADDGVIRMEVHPELSTGEVKLIGTFALPEKSTTQVTSNIMCVDGSTVVIGGLIREDTSSTVSQVPYIGHLPVLGAPFRNRTETVKRTEIIVLITPRIVQDPVMGEDGAACLADFDNRQASTFAKRHAGIHRKHYARRYYHLAESAFVAGNYAAAMRYLNICLKFDPQDANGLKLRNKIGCVSPECGPQMAPPVAPPDYIETPIPSASPPQGTHSPEALPPGLILPDSNIGRPPS